MLGKYSFKPSLLALALVFILVPLFVSLAFWQLRRAEEKEQFKLQSASQAAQIALQGRDILESPSSSLRFRSVALEGTFDRDHQFLLDNQMQSGRPGYHVLAPFRVDGLNLSILINRGWIPMGIDRAQMPDLRGLPEARVLIRGKIDFLHRVGFRLKGMEQPSLGWPSVVQLPEPEPLGQRLGYPLADFQVLLDPAEPGGFDYPLKSEALDSVRNRAYALQWFLFALATLILFLRASLHSRKNSS